MGDYSTNYTEDKKGYIVVKFANKTVKFKPFVDSISFTVDRKDSDVKKNIYTDASVTGGFKSARYNLSFNVLASNLDEAIENHKKFQKLIRMICPDELNMSSNRVVNLKFSNLVSGKKGMGFDGIIQKTNYKPIMELGFFEDNGFIFAKGFVLSIDIINEPTATIEEVAYRRSSFYYGNTSLKQKKTDKNKPNDVGPPKPEKTKKEKEKEKKKQKGGGDIPAKPAKPDTTPSDDGTEGKGPYK